MEVPHDQSHDSDDVVVGSLVPIPDNPQAVLEASPDRATFVLIALDRARQWLISAGSVEEVNELRARAEAVRVYTRQAELGKEAENAAAEIRLRAERRVGELLKEMDVRPGNPSRREGLKLADQGLSAKESMTFQRMAAIPEDDFEGRLTAAKQNGRVSRAAILRDEDAAHDAVTGDTVSTSEFARHADHAAVQRLAADLAPPTTYRYRLALARIAEQASHISQFDAEEAAQLVDENSAIVLESAARTWESWVARFKRARGQLRAIPGGQ